MNVSWRPPALIEPGLSEKVAFLSEPTAYVPQPQRVERKETHMSWVFLTDRHAWKLKKPVRYDFLDFSTVEARKRNCELEVTLNRRLAPDVYLGAVPLVLDRQARMRLGGKGSVIDWLVQMRRLPQHRMLDAAIAAHAVGAADLDKVGKLLARFYQRARRIPLTPREYVARLEAAGRESARELQCPEHRLPREWIESLYERHSALLRRAAAQLCDRARRGKLVDAHGDLRPEHICLEATPVIIDCLEFNPEFRALDTVSELSFLWLECERLGAPWVGEAIFQTYCQETGDHPPRALVDFYKLQHALVRAKIAVWHLRDPGPGDAPKWIARAKEYLLRAESFK
jgi:aminoglycoside phosphotransferase family enzyme